MTILRHAFALVPGMFLCLTGWSQQNNPPQVPDTVLKSKKDLKEVIVTGKKPLVTRKSDRYIINVENSFLANGNTGLEVLQKSPGIWVDPNGRIRIKGNQSVTVIINDVVQRMSSEDLAEYLKTLRSEDISKIEVISNPPAEFEAAGSGGVVHIILKRSRKDGFNGSVNVQYRQRRNKPNYSAGGSLNYKVNKLYLNVGYTFTEDIHPIYETADLVYADKSRMNTYTNRLDKFIRQPLRVGIGYDLSNKQYLEIQNNANFYRWKQTFNTDLQYLMPGQLVTGTTHSNKNRFFIFSSTTLNYLYRLDTIGSKLTVNAEYTSYDKTEANNFYEYYSGHFPDSVYTTSVPFTSGVFSSQANYLKMLTSARSFKVGAKYVAMQRDNERIINEVGDNRFIYKEQLLMGYTSIEQSVKKWVISTGVRVEHSELQGHEIYSGAQFQRAYTSFFPSASVMRKLNEQKDNSIYISYSKRIQRPAMNEMNPAWYLYNKYTVLVGNPDLLPQYTHNIEAGFNFLHGYSATIYLAASNNIINMQVTQSADNAIEYRFQNFGKSTEYGFNFNAPVKIGKIYTINNSLSLFHMTYNWAGIPDRTSFSAKTMHSFTPEKWCDVEVIADYRSPTVYPGWRSPYMFYFDLGFSKKVLKKQGRVKLFFSDIFNTYREKEISKTNTSETIFYRKRPTRWVSLSFTYNFSGGLKFTNRKIEINNDEKNRVGS